MNNIFLNNDPLLSQQADYAARLGEIRQMQEELERRRSAMQPSAHRAPVWEEINRIMEELSDAEVQHLQTDEDFRLSEQTVMAILQDEYMKIMRPVVEGTQRGREALENHLQLLKTIRKKASREASREMDSFREYTEKYSHMTYKEFQEMKGHKK